MGVYFSSFRLVRGRGTGNSMNVTVNFAASILGRRLPISLERCAAVLSPRMSSSEGLVRGRRGLRHVSGIIRALVSGLSTGRGYGQMRLFLSIRSALTVGVNDEFRRNVRGG